MDIQVKDFILASASPQRRRLLEQIGFAPKEVMSADIDEAELPHERPLPYVRRMARQKAEAVALLKKGENILASDTIITVGLRIVHKAKSPKEQEDVMRLLSGRNHKVITAVCLIDKNGKLTDRIVTTRISMKRLSEKEIKEYVASNGLAFVVTKSKACSPVMFVKWSAHSPVLSGCLYMKHEI